MREICCENCKNFKEYSKDKHEDDRGECRRHSPIISLNGVSRWPMVVMSDWCGDFEKKSVDSHEH